MAGGCPICKKPEDVKFRPFCSQRCAQIDLSRWLGDGYAIPGEPLEDLPAADPETLRRGMTKIDE